MAGALMRRILPVLVALSQAGCASTHVDVATGKPGSSWCQEGTEQLSALVLWTTDWRPDQKDVPRREQAADQGIRDFFADAGCFARVEVRHIAPGSLSQPAQLRSLATESGFVPDRVLAITVRELGPVVKLLSSWQLVEGGTEVVVDITASTPARPAPPEVLKVHSQNGGPLAIKGVATLPADMKAALAAGLRPAAR
jgi:hypothetical protein